MPGATIAAFRRLPDPQRHEIPGLGDEAYRARFGGGVVVRAGDRVAMITPHLPDLDPGGRDELALRVARAVVGPADRPGGAGRAAAGGGRRRRGRRERRLNHLAYR